MDLQPILPNSGKTFRLKLGGRPDETESVETKQSGPERSNDFKNGKRPSQLRASEVLNGIAVDFWLGFPRVGVVSTPSKDPPLFYLLSAMK
jgi:hypothetical protein